MKTLGIYIHIPFCRQRCLYCGFHSNAVGRPASVPGRPFTAEGLPPAALRAAAGGAPGAGGIFGAGAGLGAAPPAPAACGGGRQATDGGRQAMTAYTQWLIGQIMEKGKLYRKKYLVDTVFLGGGTPSLLPPEAVEAILGALRESFVLASDAEITIEANPESLDAKKLKRYLGAGINRLSMGVQSFDDGVLAGLGRIHDGAEAEAKFRLARKCGFRNINIDLMFAVPGQTRAQWEATVEKALSLEPEHISFYGLQIEEDTPFYQAYIDGELPLVTEEEDRGMYHWAVKRLQAAGLEHYEISNAARPGFRCRHNWKYWSFEDYLGIGDSASSFLEGVRTTEKPRAERHENDFEDSTAEYVFTGLRKREGISKTAFEDCFGRPFWDVYGSRRDRMEEFFASGALLEEGDELRLSEQGIDISNRIMALFV